MCLVLQTFFVITGGTPRNLEALKDCVNYQVFSHFSMKVLWGCLQKI